MGDHQRFPRRCFTCGLFAAALLAPGRSEAVFSLGMQSTAYLSGSSSAVRSSQDNINLATAGIDWSGRASSFETSVRATGAFSLSRKTSGYVSISELNAGWVPVASGAGLHAGRRLQEWSLPDDVWGLGLWQPRFRWDYLRPRPTGLTGVFLETAPRGEKKSGGVRAVAFGSPIFVPETDGTFEFREGQVYSHNPFLIPPGSTLTLFGQSTPIRYEIEKYSLRDIVARPSGGVLVEAAAAGGWWVRPAYAYKPVNQIGLGYTGYFNMPTSTVDVFIRPAPIYHHLVSLDAGLRKRAISAALSAMADVPRQDGGFPPGTTVLRYRRAMVLSPTVEAPWGGGSRRARLTYLRVLGGASEDEGPLASGNGSVFEPRFLMLDAIKGGLDGALPGALARDWSFETTLTYDRSSTLSIFSAGLGYQPARSWKVRVGGDFLAMARSPGVGPDSSRLAFLKQYVAHDRFQGGVEYAF